MSIISLIERIEQIRFEAISDARVDHANGDERIRLQRFSKQYRKEYWKERGRLGREASHVK